MGKRRRKRKVSKQSLLDAEKLKNLLFNSEDTIKLPCAPSKKPESPRKYQPSESGNWRGSMINDTEKTPKSWERNSEKIHSFSDNGNNKPEKKSNFWSSSSDTGDKWGRGKTLTDNKQETKERDWGRGGGIESPANRHSSSGEAIWSRGTQVTKFSLSQKHKHSVSEETNWRRGTQVSKKEQTSPRQSGYDQKTSPISPISQASESKTWERGVKLMVK